MKFFKQTKETKRKISFFMALAMVISLLPVSPVAKAATTKTNDSCNVYVNLDETSKDYVKVAKVITGGAVGQKEATTASVIVTPLEGVTLKGVTPENTGSMEVKADRAVTLGSISLEKGGVATSASVVVREKTDNVGKAETAVSPSSALANDVIAKVSLSATSTALTEADKKIDGALISIDGIAANKNIEVAIVMEDGKVIPPVGDKGVAVEFIDQTDAGAVFEAKIGEKVVATSSGTIKSTSSRFWTRKDACNIWYSVKIMTAIKKTQTNCWTPRNVTL